MKINEIDVKYSKQAMEIVGAKQPGKRPPKVLDRGRSRNSWNITILGQEISLDEALRLRVKRAEILTGSFGFIGLALFIVGSIMDNSSIRLACIVFVFAALFSLVIIYYENVSFRIFKRLLKEPNVIVVTILGMCNVIIDCGKPDHPLSPIMGVIYLLITYGVMFTDVELIGIPHMVIVSNRNLN